MILLIVAVTGATVGPGVVRWLVEHVGLGDTMHGLDTFWAWIRWPLSVSALIALLAAAYNFLPNVRHGYGLVSFGSIIAVILWLVVTWGFRMFVAAFGAYARTYGALAAVVMLLTWFYLTGIMVILGAEVNAAIAHVHEEMRHGDPVT